MQADNADIIILPGDLTYADDYNADDRVGYQPRWDIWGRLSQFLFANTILVPTIGARDLHHASIQCRYCFAGNGMQSHPAICLNPARDHHHQPNQNPMQTSVQHSAARPFYDNVLQLYGPIKTMAGCCTGIGWLAAA